MRFQGGVFAFTDDVAPRGMRITTGFPVPPGDPVVGTLTLPGGERVGFSGRVLWTRPSPDGRTILGIGFEEIDAPYGALFEAPKRRSVA